MKPIKFKESNQILLKPKSMTDEECQPLPVFFDSGRYTSCWKLSFFEVIQVLLSRKVWLWVWGNHPPVYVSAEFPFYKSRIK